MKTKTTFSSALFVVLLSLCFTITAYSQMQNWSMLNCDRERSSWAKNEIILYPPLQITSELNITPGASSISGITYHNGLLCVSTSINSTNVVEAIDVASGDTLWTFQVPGGRGGMGFICAQTDSLVFAGGQYGLGLYALDRQTGDIKWDKPMGNLYTRNIMLDGDLAFIVSDTLYCLNVNDGSTNWGTYAQRHIQTSPAIDETNVYLAGKEKLRIYDKQTGELIWEKYNSPESSGSVTVDAQCFYTFSNDTIFAYNKEDRDIKWFYERPGVTIQINSQNTFALNDDVLFFTVRNNGNDNGQLIALNKTNGEYMWERGFIGEWVNAPVIANGVVYVIPGAEDALYGFKPDTGEQLFYDKTFNYQSQPIVADHKLFVATSQRRIIVFENENITSIANSTIIPGGFELSQNYPNPFNPSTNIKFALPESQKVTLKIFNVMGQEIETLLNEYKTAGVYEITWVAPEVPGGIYFYRFKAGDFSKTNKLILLK